MQGGVISAFLGHRGDEGFRAFLFLSCVGRARRLLQILQREQSQNYVIACGEHG